MIMQNKTLICDLYVVINSQYASNMPVVNSENTFLNLCYVLYLVMITLIE